MRTTISIDEQVLNAAKRIALESGRTLGCVIEDGLRVAYLSGDKPQAKVPPAPILTFRGTGVRPGVKLSSSGELLDVMEGR